HEAELATADRGTAWPGERQQQRGLGAGVAELARGDSSLDEIAGERAELRDPQRRLAHVRRGGLEGCERLGHPALAERDVAEDPLVAGPMPRIGGGPGHRGEHRACPLELAAIRRDDRARPGEGVCVLLAARRRPDLLGVAEVALRLVPAPREELEPPERELRVGPVPEIAALLGAVQEVEEQPSSLVELVAPQADRREMELARVGYGKVDV